MGFEYEIDTEKNLVRNRWTGPIPLDQFISQSRRVTDDPDFERGMNTLSDCREADWSAESDSAHEFVWHTEILERTRGAAKWAVLVRDAEMAESVETFDMVLKQRGIKIEARAFVSEAEALAWLGIEP